MATVTGAPEFSLYVDLRDGTKIGVHKFILLQAGPLFDNTVQWSVRRLSPGSTIGATLGLSGQVNPLSVSSVGTARTTAAITFSSGILTSWSSWSATGPNEVYVCTIHQGADQLFV